MRIAVVLDPPALAITTRAWLRDTLDTNESAVTVAMLPSIDPLTRALAHALGAQEQGEAGFVVLARVGTGRLDSAQWKQLGLDARVKRLEPVEDPDIEGAIAEGAQHLSRKEWDRAHRAYSVADSLLAQEHGPRRAEVLVCLAGIEAARGATAAAASLLDRALAIFPDHQAGLRQRIELARASADHATAAALRRRLLRRAESDVERAETLASIADESLDAATEALEQALSLRPRDPRLLERLQATAEASGDWRKAVDTKVALSETIESAKDRARSLTAAAGMCARRTNDIPRAVALYEAAIADDPSAPGAFEAIEAVLLKNNDYGSVERAYARQLERLSGREQIGAEVALLEKLALVRAERLGDVHGAVFALDQLVMLQPENVEARAKLATLLEQTGELPLAAKCLENAAIWAPTRPQTFRDLRRISDQLGDLDRAYCACAVLVHLGEADVDEQRVYQEFAPETTPRPRAPLDVVGWAALRLVDHDDVVSRIVSAIAPAAIELRIEQLKAAQRLPELASGDRQNLKKTTLAAARTVAWACAVLGLPEPEVYAKNVDVPGGLAHLPLREPTVLLGKSMLSGRSVPELAFATARELAAQHLTSRLVTYYPSTAELRAVVVSAVAQVLPSSLPSDALRLRDALKAKIDPTRRAELERAVEALQARDGRLDLNGWIRAVEIASCRAGLVVCSDITAAARMLAVDGRVVAGLSAADRIRDLIPFSVSEHCGALRRAIGVDARRYTSPPPAF